MPELDARTFPGDPNPPASPMDIQVTNITRRVRAETARLYPDTAEEDVLGADNIRRLTADPDSPLGKASMEVLNITGQKSIPELERVGFRPPTGPTTNYFEPPPAGEPQFYVSGNHAYRSDPDGTETDLGEVNPDSQHILESSGAYHEGTKTWDLPQDVAEALVSGRLAYPEFMMAKYRAGEATVLRGLPGSKFLRGEMSLAEADARGDLQLLKMQVKDAPALAWSGGYGKIVGDAVAFAASNPLEAAQRTGRFMTGETAQMAPFMLGALESSAKGAVAFGVIGIGATAVTVMSGGTAAPISMAMMGAWMQTGAAFGVFKYSVDIEAGNAALDMHNAGFDEAAIRKYAPVIGVLKGGLEVVGFKYLTEPLKRKVIGTLLASAPVKAALTKWYINYAKELGAEVSVEIAQDAIETGITNIAAVVEANPDAFTDMDTFMDETMMTALTATAGMALMKAPGAALDIHTERKETKAEVAMTKGLEAREKMITDVAKSEVKDIPDIMAELDKIEADLEAKLAEIDEEAQFQELVDGSETGKVSPEELKKAVDELPEGLEKGEEVIGESKDDKPKTPKKKRAKPPTLAERTKTLESNSRVRALQTKMRETKALLKEQTDARTRLLKQKGSVKMLDKKIAKNLIIEKSLQSELDFYAETAAVEATVPINVPLEMEPVTLEAVIEAGFKEGRKSVIAIRAKAIKKIASDAGLTQADLRNVLKNKNIGLMGDEKFKNYLEKFTAQVEALGKRKSLEALVRAALKVKAINREHNIRALAKLPAIGKMTSGELMRYFEILGQYEKGDTALTPKKIKALETTVLAGAKTFREVMEKASEKLNVTFAELEASQKGEFDIFTYDTPLARENAMYKFMVEQVKVAEMIENAKYHAMRDKMYELGAKALASRKRGLIGRMTATQPEVMQYLEATREEKAILEGFLTPEEMEFAQFLEAAYAEAYEYLRQTGELQNSRFEEGYMFHSKRPISEMLVGIKDIGWKKTLSEFLTRWKVDETKFSVTNSDGTALGMRKFFKQTLFRSGELTPTKNVIKAADTYFSQLAKKKALDRAVPTVETLADSLAVESADQSESSQQRRKQLGKFIDIYLNAKKGQWVMTGVEQGGKIDAAIRALNGFLSIRYIAAHYPLQFAAVIGETTAKTIHLGTRGMIKAHYRKLVSAQGKAILKKYEHFTGDPLLKARKQPGRTIDDSIGTILYGIFEWNRVNTMQDILLAGMTDAEFKAGEISAERLAELKIKAGRWIDVTGAKSVFGSSSFGAINTKFKGWAIPVISTLVGTNDGSVWALARTISRQGDPNKRLTMEQGHELRRIAMTVALATYAASSALNDEDDDSQLGQFIRYAIRELSLAAQALSPLTIFGFVTGGVAATFLGRVALNIGLLIKLEEYQDINREGLKGWEGLKRQFTPAATPIQMLLSDDEE